MSAGCETALVSAPTVTEVESTAGGGTLESYLQVTELEVRPQVTELDTFVERVTVLETSTPGMDGQPGRELLLNRELLGDRDGVNQTFTTPTPFDATAGICLYFNGQRLQEGSIPGYSVIESGGIGTGVVVTFRPRSTHCLLADYYSP